MENSIIAFLEREEGRKLHSYQDGAGVWTIGVGSTMYMNGKPVGPGETITNAQADELRNWEIGNKSKIIQSLIGNLNLPQHKIVALISFTYQEGVSGLTGSTLLKVIKSNPSDITMVAVDNVQDASVKKWMINNNWTEVNLIRLCFMMWNKVKNPETKMKEFSEAILQRRLREADLYLKC